MQIKNTNYQISQPNFQARYLSRSVSTAAKNRAESVIDILFILTNLFTIRQEERKMIKILLNGFLTF